MTAKEMIQEQKAKAQAVVDGFDAIDSQLDQDLKSEYDRGFAEGKASMGNPGDKIYDQAEVDALLKPIQDSLVAKESQIAQLQSDIDAIRSGIDAQVETKMGEFKASIKKAYDDQQVAESQGETGFAELLK